MSGKTFLFLVMIIFLSTPSHSQIISFCAGNTGTHNDFDHNRVFFSPDNYDDSVSLGAVEIPSTGSQIAYDTNPITDSGLWPRILHPGTQTLESPATDSSPIIGYSPITASCINPSFNPFDNIEPWVDLVAWQTCAIQTLFQFGLDYSGPNVPVYNKNNATATDSLPQSLTVIAFQGHISELDTLNLQTGAQDSLDAFFDPNNGGYASSLVAAFTIPVNNDPASLTGVAPLAINFVEQALYPGVLEWTLFSWAAIYDANPAGQTQPPCVLLSPPVYISTTP